MHDHVIQRLFGVGLALQSAIPLASSSNDVQRRLSDSVDNLHKVVREIRTTIFDLHGAGAVGLWQRLDEAIAQFSAPDISTDVHMSGPLFRITGQLADHAEAVVREAVSNAVRHASPRALTVDVRVDDYLTIEVSDDGTGIPDVSSSRGLANLKRRAAQAGGTLSVERRPRGGTRLTWSAPVR